MTDEHPITLLGNDGDGAKLDQMLAQWRRVQHLESDRWTAQLRAMKDQQAKLSIAGKWLGGPSDLLSIIGRGRRELLHCSMLAWYLWPGGRHGFGVHFLAAFLEALGLPTASRSGLALTTTATEVVKANSRADVVLRSPDFTVVIEAKVDAEEGSRQCARLEQDHEDAHFVFLAPGGRQPTTAADPTLWLSLSLADVRALLERVVGEHPPQDAVAAATTHTYLHTLRQEFP